MVYLLLLFILSFILFIDIKIMLYLSPPTNRTDRTETCKCVTSIHATDNIFRFVYGETAINQLEKLMSH